MRYAIVSDLHANLEALTAVLGSIENDSVDSLVCLGDLVGYHASPNECVRLVRERGIRSIAGNHDRAAIGRKDPASFGRQARRAIGWTKSALSSESAAFLLTLPSTMLVDDCFFAVHGALHPEPNDDLHLSTPLRVQESFSALRSGRFGSSLCFFGHTHRPVAFEQRSGEIRRIMSERVELFPDRKYLVNPGSVGQPRDGDERACYAVFDSDRGVVEWRRVAYDVASALGRARAAGLGEEPTLLSRIRERGLTRLSDVFARHRV